MFQSGLDSAYRRLSPSARAWVKKLSGSQGHGRGQLDALKRWRHAAGKKRLDRAAEALCQDLADAGLHCVIGKACLEFGTGYSLSEPLLYHLLGATRACGFDVNLLGTAGSAYRSLILADPVRLKAATRAMVVPEAFDAQLEQLRKMDKRQFARFMGDHIPYRTGADIACLASEGPFDLIHSMSVLEHVEPDCLPAILDGLAGSLSAGGTLVNRIDLRDHRDPDQAPLAFLAEEPYAPQSIDVRGNRLRHSDWNALFAAIPGARTRIIVSRRAEHAHMPATLASRFRDRPIDNLCITEIVTVTLRQ